MIEVVGVSFKNNSKLYYFSPKGLKIKKGINVIVKTERGLQFGKVELSNTEIEDSNIKTALSEVVRIASKKDYDKHLKNVEDAKQAINKCKELVEKFDLNMIILDANYTFDKSQLLFTFLADNRTELAWKRICC